VTSDDWDAQGATFDEEPALSGRAIDDERYLLVSRR